MDADQSSLPAAPGARRGTVAPPPPSDLIRCGAELVELSERFYRGTFIGGVIFVGLAGTAALALLPLRQSDATYATVTVLLTALLVAAIPVAVWRAGALYRLLRRREEARVVLVLLAAGLVVYPLRSELWWPSCALLMLLASLVSLPRVLAYCLIVLLANLAAHMIAGDLNETPPVAIIGLWVGFIFWSSAFAIVIDRLTSHVLRLNTPLPAGRLPPLRVDVGQRFVSQPASSDAKPDRASSSEEAAIDSAPGAAAQGGRLTARQLQVVALLADGLRYDEVAACLAISVRQVRRHVTNAIARLGVRNANELVAVAVAEGVVPES